MFVVVLAEVYENALALGLRLCDEQTVTCRIAIDEDNGWSPKCFLGP